MSIKKLSLANAKQLSKSEMMKIMAGSGDSCNCNSKDDCGASKPVCTNGCGGSTGDKWQGLCDTQ